jgi:hypothetical protein
MGKLAFRFSEKEFGWPVCTSCSGACSTWGRTFYCCLSRASGYWTGDWIYSVFIFVTVLRTFRPSIVISVKKESWLNLSSTGELGRHPLFFGVSGSKPPSWGLWGLFEVASPLRFEADMLDLSSNCANSFFPASYEVGVMSVKSQAACCCISSSLLFIFCSLAVNCRILKASC